MSDPQTRAGVAVRTLSLVAVFAVAKLAALAGRDLPWSVWGPLVWLWQDLAIALLIGAIDFAVRSSAVGWALYVGTVGYVALNVGVVRVLSSSLTLPMLRAARGTLRDSISHYFQASHFLAMFAVVVAAILFPMLFQRTRMRLHPLALAAALSLIAVGSFATARLETRGLHRHPFVVLIDSALPRVRAQPAAGDWRRSPFQQARREDLTHLRGAATGRHVVMILLESTGAQYLKLYGAAEDPTPHLTALAARGIIFENAYCVYPESIKGLFSVLCSRQPAFDLDAQLYARVRTPSLAQLLAPRGYRTALFHSGRFMYLGMEAIVQERGFEVLEDAGAISGQSQSSFGVDEPATVQRMLAWIDSRPAAQPFFITYLPIAGHHPYSTPAPRPFPDTPEVNAYRNALHFGDAALGKFFGGLKDRGLLDRTLFVIFGDHGEAFGQHEGNTGHTLFIYEENVRVPFFIVMPGRNTTQLRVTRTASLLDVAPTILELLGVAAPKTYQGTSLLRDREQMALFYTDYALSLAGLRDGPWKFMFELRSGRAKLFHLGEDHGEQRSLAGEHPERVRVYREHLRSWSAAQKAQLLSEVERTSR